MKNLTIVASALVVGMAFQASAFAQTCANPLAINSNSQVSGDTCTATNSLPTYGATGSPQTEIVYSFVAQGANATISVGNTTGFNGSTPFFVLMPSPCAPGTDYIKAGAAGADMAVNGLIDGQTYYVIMTADPTGPANACGTYTLTVTGILPVELKKFSID